MVGSPLKSKNDSMFLGGPSPYPSSSTPSTPATPPKTPTKPSTPSAPAAAADKYTVVSGDTLAKIAVAKKVSGGWQALYAANKSVVGSNPNLIYPGQKLTIPQPEVKYTVKSGDNLTKIATNLGVKGGWKALYDKNKDVIGDNPNMIKPGMVLVVSGGTGSSAPSTPSTPSTPAKPSTPDNSTPSTNGWVAPLAKGTYTKGDNVTQNGACISRTCGGHSGLDMSAKSGTPVKAIASGTVVFAGYGYADPSGAYGLEIILKLPDGKYALYGHLSAKTVSTGDKVSAGQMIGNVGSSGNSSGPHLHFEIRTDPKAFAVGIFLNPVTYMAGKGVSL
jgi:murein DD-endopeptidase MepM/ murein hydrolase activator NlpD